MNDLPACFVEMRLAIARGLAYGTHLEDDGMPGTRPAAEHAGAVDLVRGDLQPLAMDMRSSMSQLTPAALDGHQCAFPACAGGNPQACLEQRNTPALQTCAAGNESAHELHLVHAGAVDLVRGDLQPVAMPARPS